MNKELLQDLNAVYNGLNEDLDESKILLGNIIDNLEQTINYTRCCCKLKDRNDDLSELSKDLIINVEKKIPHISLPEDEELYTSLHRLKIELLKSL
jgi:hypothetical protein